MQTMQADTLDLRIKHQLTCSIDEVLQVVEWRE